jgi:glycosyltransferase involved in cell wall biosynthesis
MNTPPEPRKLTADPENPPEQPRKIRILRIINRFNLGGPTYNAAFLTKYLPDRFEIRLVGGAPLPDEAHSGFILDRLGVEYLEITEMGRRVRLRDDLRAYRHIARLIRSFKPDIVHTHAAKAGALGRLAARLNGAPVVVHTFHGHVFSSYFTGVKAWLVKWTERRLSGLSSAIVTLSRQQHLELTDTYRICSPARTHIIPLGFDLSRFLCGNTEKRKRFRTEYGIGDDEFAVGIIGRFAPVKNHTFFIDVLKAIRRMHPKLKCKAFIIGDGESRRDLEAYCQPLRVAGKDGAHDADVFFTSWIKDIDHVIAGLDLVALTSLNEGTPVSLIEAQAAGVPVISSDAGGVRDCVRDGESGVVMPSFDADAWADRIASLAAQPEARKNMGIAGRAFAIREFSYDKMVERMAALYDALLAARRS